MEVENSDKVYDYYMHIYKQYQGFKGVNLKHIRKLIKKAVMTINYGLTRIGCQKKLYLLLKEYKYCLD
jgi:hypothetical protein